MLSQHHETSSAPRSPTAPVHYPTSDHMGESGLQFFVCNLMLIPLLRSYFMDLGKPVLIGGNQNFYYQKGEPGLYLAPDVYIVDDETTPLEEVKSWKLWEHGGKGPVLAVEVVSDEYEKDYHPDCLVQYQRLGVRELFRYDPLHYLHPRATKHGPRTLLTHFVRNEQGVLVEQATPRKNAARSTVFDFWLTHQAPRSLRLALGPRGTVFWPTEAERATVEAERATVEAERATVEAERAARAELEIDRLRAELARLRGEPRDEA